MKNISLALSVAPALACRDILVRDSDRSLKGLVAEFSSHLRPLVEDRDVQVQLKVSYALPLLQTSVLQVCLTRNAAALQKAPGGEWLMERVGDVTRLRHTSAGSWREGRLDEPAEEALVRRLVEVMSSEYQTVELSSAEKDLVGDAPSRAR